MGGWLRSYVLQTFAVGLSLMALFGPGAGVGLGVGAAHGFATPEAAGEADEVMSPKIAGLHQMLQKARPGEEDAIISALIEENRDRFPITEDSLATFVYYGRVGLRVTVPSDLNRWDTKAHQMTRIGETDLHYITLELPRDARIDYKFYVDGAWMLDPLNPNTVMGGFGPNSELSMPDHEFPEEILPVDTIPLGELEVHHFESRIMNNSRNVGIVKVYSMDQGSVGTSGVFT